MTDFSWIDDLVRDGDADAAFERLVARFTQEKQYRRIFDARLMQTRRRLGLPLVSQPAIDDLPKDMQATYHDAYVRAAREVGELFLSSGDIAAAWPYFRAIGDTGPIVSALDQFDATEATTPESHDRVGAAIQIAYQEAVHPRKGFELILNHFGLCRAITMFSAYPVRDGRTASLQLLVRALHDQLVDNLKGAIETVEGARPDARSIAALVTDRPWLFEPNVQHIDSTHLVAVLRMGAELDDPETLRLAVAMAYYGTRLGPMFQHADDPPFDRVYEDRAVYLRALLGEDVDRAVRHFTDKIARFPPAEYGFGPVETLISLLVRRGRYRDAIQIFRQYLADAGPQDLSCPSLAHLYELAGDFDQLKALAAKQSDPLSFLAAVIQGSPRT